MTENALQGNICTKPCTSSSEIVDLKKERDLMEQLLTLKIFKILCESNEYITSQALADKLMISSRSVKTYMGQVKRMCSG